MTTAARAEGLVGEPGALRPRALEMIEALFSAPNRTRAAWRLGREIGDTESGASTVKLLHAMADLGLVEPVDACGGGNSRWRLLVEGPIRPMSDHILHIRRRPNDMITAPVWCGKIGVSSISEAWGYYGPGGDGHDDVCRACLRAQREARHSQKGTSA